MLDQVAEPPGDDDQIISGKDREVAVLADAPQQTNTVTFGGIDTATQARST